HLHHSADPRDCDRNFAGTFPLTDLLFGTYRAPAFPTAVGCATVPEQIERATLNPCARGASTSEG
ncbi:MAG: hypothetical protein H6Q89_974, partial [Myxococcaceae bacterium]|nr:hypothetical protein [Myxococcaceae bacterium]